MKAENCSLKLKIGDSMKFEVRGPEALVALKSKEYMDFLHQHCGGTATAQEAPAQAAPAGGGFAPGQIVPLWPSVRQETDTEPVDWDIVAIYDKACCEALAQAFEADLKVSRKVPRDGQPGWLARFEQAVARLLSPLL